MKKGNRMRSPSFLAPAVFVCLVTVVRADGLITRLPADGTWALYTMTETAAIPDKKGGDTTTVAGTLKLASVGREMVKGEACRWIELVLEATPPGAAAPQVVVFKALAPEKFLAKGQDPRTHWRKGWMKLGDQPPQALTPERLAAPVLKLNLLVTGPLQETKDLEEKTVETGVGQLTCKGVSGFLVIRGGSVSVKNGQAEAGDAKLRVESYFHDKAPFGVAAWRGILMLDVAGGQATTSDSTLTLSRVGKDAKSVLPENR
jgi:hypothetical protein